MNEISSLILEILGAIGTAALVLFGLSSWLGKVWANRILETEKAKYAEELERLRSVLIGIQKENEIRFGRLHEKQSEIIEQLYDKLNQTSHAFWSLVKPMQNVGEKCEKDKYEYFLETYAKYHDYFQLKRIYFSPSICGKFDSINKMLFSANFDLRRFPLETEGEIVYEEGSVPARKYQAWDKHRESFETIVISLKAELENDFRQILGVIGSHPQ